MTTPSSANSPEDNLAKGRQMAIGHQGRYDAVQARRAAPGDRIFDIDAVNLVIRDDATEKDVREIEGDIQAAEQAATDEVKEIENKAMKSSTPSEFAELREADERSSWQIARMNSALRIALKKAVTMLKEYPEMRKEFAQVPDLRRQNTVLEQELANHRGDVKLEAQEEFERLRELAAQYLKSSDTAEKIISEWQERVLLQSYGASSDVQLDIVHALQVVRSKQSQGISKAEIGQASKSMRACLESYPAGPSKLGFEMWLYSTAHPMQLDSSILLGLLNQGASVTDIAFVHLTVEHYAINPALHLLGLGTSHALLNACEWLLNVPGADRNIIKTWLDRLGPKLHSDQVIQFTLDWLRMYGTESSTLLRPQALLENQNVNREQRLKLNTGSEIIRYGAWILHVTSTQIKWLKEENFHMYLDDELIGSEEFMLVYKGKEERSNLKSRMSTTSSDLSKLAKVLPGIKVKGSN